jgi:hypothetical protein
MNYSTSTILDMLAIEKEENSLVSREMLDAAIAWIDTFQAYPEIEFYLDGEPREAELLLYLESNKPIIEKTVAAYMKKLHRTYGRRPKPPEQVRSEHICVYLTGAEMAELANLAGAQVPEQKRGGDTANRRKIASYLRDAGFRELPLPS